MEEKELQNELASIRSIMERSSKFISLSGLSGILAGIYALIGAFLAYKLVYSGLPSPYNPYVQASSSDNTAGVSYGYVSNFPLEIVFIGILVLVASIVTAVILSKRQAKRKGQPFWGKTSQALFFHMATPLITGGILVTMLLYQDTVAYVVPTMLIFYGLSLVSASNFTFSDVKYLGLLEIILGLIAACLPGYGLLFWAIGFGVLHIIYGGMMYLKYDK
ncbi:MAG TPA: hypothetical protein VK671_16625 [Mucilaginibacter sp.]|nr:hypothetical protein [Mucilaginibacter sp.]